MRNLWVLGLHLILFSTFMASIACLGAQNFTTRCHERERLALLKFKYSVKDDFKMLSSWVGFDCCSWVGVHCDGAIGRVVSLHLRGSVRELSYWLEDISFGARYIEDKYFVAEEDLVGEEYYLVGEYVNPSLAELRHLKYMDLSGNDFQGSRIPEFIGSLKQLSYLNLSNAGFSGRIPHHIGNLSNLKVLDLSSTPYEHTLTSYDMVWISGLLSLEYLDLNGVNLRGANNRNMVLYMIPSIIHLSVSYCGFSNVDLAVPRLNLSRMLPNIKYLQLRDNAIGGQFPYVLTNMSSLVSLDLSYNLINSSIPLMPNLLKLDLSNNNIRLTDHIGICRQCNLKELIVIHNNLEGELIGASTNASVCSQYALETLDLSLNELSGSITESLGRLTGLRTLRLQLNRLKGSIPEALGRIRFLEVLDLSYNQLDGPIPTFLGQLTELDVSNNQLNCSIPESFGGLATLTYLNLERNRLTGAIPVSLGGLVMLKTFSVCSNLLNGTIPAVLGKLTKLVLLDVSNNSFEGVVSEGHFSNLSMLKYMDLSYNMNLTFSVSRQWIPPFQMKKIRLASCNISNEFPKWLQTQKKVDELVLSNASISGPLPAWLRHMAIIRVLDLSQNKLNGALTNLPFGGPLNGFKDEDMGSLYLQNNLFNGLIPRSLCLRTELEFLDLSNNRLTGKVPNCLANLQNLRMMIFASNKLSGAIPSTSSGRFLPRLSWLNLNNNSFNGELPRDYLGMLPNLRVLDLGENEFSGKIPKWIGENLTLMVLRLHKNNFSGRIPQSLCKSSYLQILDLAHNHLTGQVPRCFGELRGMTKDFYNGMLHNISRDDPYGNIIQVIKGFNLEYSKTLDLVYNMDLSSNQLVGPIPEELMTLSQLVGLNLSHNHLSGGIPNTIGNMKALNSLDFSYNKLTGMIPPSLASLYFLSFLNLSYNNLSGRIPTGNQLQTLTDTSIYVGNGDLCGTPLPKNCSNHEDPSNTPSENSNREWFYSSVMCGLATGFWGVIGVLLLKKQWRHKLFVLVEVIMDMIYVAVVMRVSKTKII